MTSARPNTARPGLPQAWQKSPAHRPVGELLVPNPKARLREQFHEVMRFKHYAPRTEESYWQWVRRFLWFHRAKTSPAAAAGGPSNGSPDGWRHPAEMGEAQVHAFLTHLAVNQNVAPSTQNQALNALVFLYAQVLHKPLGQLDEFARPHHARHIPVVLTQSEAQRLIAVAAEPYALIIRLLYGTGMRVMEGLRLRVKDLDFGAGYIVVRDGKGCKDRVAILPGSLRAALQTQLQRARTFHEQDIAMGFGQVHLPYALARKYPRAEREWCWQYVFPAPAALA